MFWFLVAFVLLILLVKQRDETKAAYARGLRDGQAQLRQRIAALISGESVSASRLREELDGVAAPLPQTDISNQLESAEAAAAPAQAVAEQPRVADVPALTPEQEAAEVERRTLRNLNTMLYVGSFLIVAAAALFVNLTMPAAVKLTGLVVVTVGFYVAGLVLHANSGRLRMAAVAFVGTGLAILPFVGFALYNLTAISAELAWLLTSLVGLLAYGFAAVRLQSELVSYITMAFVVSLGLSAVSTLSLAVIWYFVVVIGISLLANCLAILWPNLLPKVFSKPVEQTGQIVTPIALLASVVAADAMDFLMYEILFGVASLHYLVVWLLSRSAIYELVTRALVHVTGLIIAADIGQQAADGRYFAGIWLGLALLQGVYSLFRVKLSSASSVMAESRALVVVFGLLIVNLALWFGQVDQYAWISINLALTGLLSVVTASRLRQVAWLYIGLGASLLVPYVLLRKVIDPSVSYEVLAIIYAALGAVSVTWLERVKVADRSVGVRLFLSTASALYIALVVLSGLMTGDKASISWSLLLASGLTLALSYLVLHGVIVELIGGILMFGSVMIGTLWLVDDWNQWRPLIAIVAATATLIIGAIVHHVYAEWQRRDGLTGLAATLFAVMVMISGMSAGPQRAAVLLLIIGGIAMLVGRLKVRSRSSPMGKICLVGYIAYPLLAVVSATGLVGGWLALAVLAFTAVLWASSYIEKQPALMLAGHLGLVFGLHLLWSWLEFDADWQLFGVAWLAAGVHYVWYWLAYDRRDYQRQIAALVAALLVLGVAAIGGIFDGLGYWVMAGAGSLLMASLVTAIHGYLHAKPRYIEAAVYAATFALQRMVSVLVPEANLVVYGHWWAITVALMALWRKESGDRRYMVALGFLTASTGIYALGQGGLYSIIFLVEHLVVAVVAALIGRQWAMWWGIVAVILAVMYFLRDYTALALLFLGFLIILFVVWRLLKAGDKGTAEPKP